MSTGRPPPGTIPTLTEVVAWPGGATVATPPAATPPRGAPAPTPAPRAGIGRRRPAPVAAPADAVRHRHQHRHRLGGTGRPAVGRTAIGSRRDAVGRAGANRHAGASRGRSAGSACGAAPRGPARPRRLQRSPAPGSGVDTCSDGSRRVRHRQRFLRQRLIPRRSLTPRRLPQRRRRSSASAAAPAHSAPRHRRSAPAAATPPPAAPAPPLSRRPPFADSRDAVADGRDRRRGARAFAVHPARVWTRGDTPGGRRPRPRRRSPGRRRRRAKSSSTQRVLADLQRQVELMLEVRLREALAPILARATDALVRDARKELTAAMRDIVARSIAQELGTSRGSVKQSAAPVGCR